MQSDGEELDNIFDEHENRENNEVSHAPENIDESNNENTAGEKIQPPKRVVRNPRVKFNPDRLIGERGIPVLIQHFKDVKFKGKGHEKEDLDKLLSKLEHWTHRLFPSMKFEDCLRQIERLGTKRPVQTCVRKIRLDMPLFIGSEFVREGADDDDDVQRNGDPAPVELDAFDQLLGKTTSSNLTTTTDDDDMMGFNPLASYSPPRTNLPSESRGQILGSSTSSLTDEQKERLERNRMLAIERRKAKLAASERESSEPAAESSRCNDTHVDPVVSFDSLLQNEESKSGDSDSQSRVVSEASASNNLNSDNLGLDDLMDLVDEEVSPVPNCDQSDTKLTCKDTQSISVDTNGANMEEIGASDLEEIQNCDETDMILENKAERISNEDSVAVDENLQLESLIDLVNEGEDHQNSSGLNPTKDVEGMDHEDEENS